ncbi:MAG TPA: GspE/PulE family protein [Candidatus Baltobacteraceae bacterium]
MTVSSLEIPSDTVPDLTSDPEALRRVSRQLALGYDVLALAWDGDELAVAIPDSAGPETIDRIRYETGARIRAVVAPREMIRSRLSRAYTSVSAPIRRENDEQESGIVSLLETILEDAVERRASDIHLEPSADAGRVRMRVHGSLVLARSMANDAFERMSARIKLLAGMDIADRRQPQDGRCTIDVSGRLVDARVSTLPTPDGEKIVVRLLDAAATTAALGILGMSDETLARYRRSIRSPYGCVMVAGPTGSGKTTTLYASLADRAGDELNICSIEDPVEARLPRVSQVQIAPRAGLTFASALRAIVRQDPDVVMIGEIRDAETAHAAIEASLAGHLVLTSIHAGDGNGALERLVSFGVSRKTIASGVRAVLSQRLIRTLSPTGAYGARTGVFALSEVDASGRIPAGELGAIERQVERMVASGETDLRESRRVFGGLA